MKQSFLSKAKRFFEPILDNKKETFYLVFYFLSQYSFGVVFIFFVRSAVEALENGTKEEFQSVLIGYAILFVCLFIFIFIINKGWIYSYNRYRSTIEKKYFPRFIIFDQNSQERIGTGKTIAIISKGIKMWGGLIDRVLIHTMDFCVSAGVTLYFLWEVSYILSGLFLVLLVFGTIIGLFLNNFVMGWRMERNELDNLWSKRVVKIIMSKLEILQTNKISGEVDKLHELHEGQIFYNGKMSWYLVPFFVVGSFIICILLFAVFLFFGNSYFNGEISLGYIAALTGAILMMQTVFLNVLDFIKNFGKEFSEVQNMWDFFDTTPQIQGYEEGNTFSYASGNISLQDVTYGYTENKNIFENFSSEIEGGKITALVGPSGGGKTTLVKVIAGYIRASSGEVIVDNQKLSETALKSYYSQVGYLTQEPSVFDGTIRENLTYALHSPLAPLKERGTAISNSETPLSDSLLPGERTDTQTQLTSSPVIPANAGISNTETLVSHSPLTPLKERGTNPSLPLVEGDGGGAGPLDSRLKEIIELAQCQFIYDLPEGLDTEIGERGVKLSGGQKQRLAIAKIFLKNPQIIILDEPTSALDSVSELKITQALNNLFKGRTVLVIAHRLQTVKHADDILVIENGQIIERGTHASLVRKKGFYKQMLDLQSGF